MSTIQKKYPFKFLDAYTAQDKDIFFGREEEIKTLYEMVFQSDLILLYGSSGTGKTSLLQCGLASQFQSHDWLALSIRRGQNLNESFYKIIEEAGKGEQNNSSEAELDWLEEDWEEEGQSTAPSPTQPISPLAQKLRNIYLKYFRPIYLIFDQFEELYVLGSKAEQKEFVGIIKEVLKVEQPVKILLSVREEYLGFLYEFEKAVPELLRKKLRVEAMNLDRVRQILLGIDKNPQTNVSLKEGEKEQIAEAIFKKIRGEEKSLTIQLPYLQVFLDKLYTQITQDESHQAEAVFDLASVHKMGDIGNVLRDFLEEQVLRIAHKLRLKEEQVWKILSPFATLEGTKEPLSVAMLLDKLPTDLKGITPPLIDELVTARILRYTEKDELYEVSHDTLAKQIASKRSDEEIALLEIDRLIKNQLAFGKDLFTEKQLNIILPYLEKLSLNSQEQQLIADSQAEIKQQQQAKARRTRNIRVGVTVFIVGLLILSVIAFWQSKEANRQADLAKQQTEKVKEEKKKAEDEQRKAEQARKQAEEEKKKAEKEKENAKSAENKAQQEKEKAENAEKEAKASLKKFLAAEIKRKQDRIVQLEKDKKIYQQSDDILLIQDANREIQKLQREIRDLERQL